MNEHLATANEPPLGESDPRPETLGESDPDRAAVTAPGLRFRTARGALVNAAFMLLLELLRFFRRFVIAGLIAVSEYGLFGILAAIAGNLFRLREIGINDKFIQQTAPDQELAFQRALTLELIVAGLFSVAIAGLAPVMAAGFGERELLWLTLALASVPPGVALQAPYWIFYRRMDFVRQRLMQAVDPVVAFAVSIALAIADFGVWSLVLGLIAGVWTGAAVALAQSPYRLRLRFDRETARSYFSFSWPVALAVASGVVVAQATTIVGFATVGVAGVGIMALANSLIQYATRADDIITGTMYPALCAIQDRQRVLLETFVKSNRLLMSWALPIGAVLVLFGPEMVTGLLGDRWAEAGVLVQYFGAAAAINQVVFNWSAYYRAKGETRPLAVYGTVAATTHLAIALPMLAIWDLEGLGIGLLISTAAGVGVKLFYSRRLFPELSLVRLVSFGASPALGAAAAALGLRIAGMSLEVQALAFAAALLVLTAWLEGGLFREIGSYFRGSTPASTT